MIGDPTTAYSSVVKHMYGPDVNVDIIQPEKGKSKSRVHRESIKRIFNTLQIIISFGVGKGEQIFIK